MVRPVGVISLAVGFSGSRSNLSFTATTGNQAMRCCHAVQILLLLTSVGCTTSGGGDQAVWDFDNLDRIGGQPVVVLGDPKVIDTPEGKAIEFDGEDDGIFLSVHPLAGFEQFTAEIVFRPYAAGLDEQRFFHMEEAGESLERVMFETRLTEDNLWYLDTFVRTGDDEHTQLAADHKHPIGPWYHAAIVMDDFSFKHYVNGELEMSTPIDFRAQDAGQTSVGVRQNEVYWFKGAVRVARFTPRPLKPAEFLGSRLPENQR